MDSQGWKPETDEAPETVVPVIEEEAVVAKRRVKTGAVRVEKRVDHRLKKITAPLIQENVEVKRVPVNRVVAEIPAVRRIGDTVIVPVVEEELVVTKRLVLKEEVHLIKRRTKKRTSQEVEIGRETVRVRRISGGQER